MCWDPAAEVLTRDLVAFGKTMVTRSLLRNRGSNDESTRLDKGQISVCALLHLYSTSTQHHIHYLTHDPPHQLPSPLYFTIHKMANTHDQGFFALPTELRLEVYKHLLASSIAEGYPRRCTRGLRTSCTTIRDEIDEYVGRALLIMVLQNYWNHGSKSDHPLHVYLPTTYEFTTPLKHITLQIPVSTEFNSAKYPIGFVDLEDVLFFVTRLQLSTLTLNFYFPLPDRDVP